jgi:hypothetical protein
MSSAQNKAMWSVVLLSAALQDIIRIEMNDEKPTIHAQLTSKEQPAGVCENLLQLLEQRGSPAPGATDSEARLASAFEAAIAAAGNQGRLPAQLSRGPEYQLYAWAVLEAADRLFIITDELPSQQQSWVSRGNGRILLGSSRSYH